MQGTETSVKQKAEAGEAELARRVRLVPTGEDELAVIIEQQERGTSPAEVVRVVVKASALAQAVGIATGMKYA